MGSRKEGEEGQSEGYRKLVRDGEPEDRMQRTRGGQEAGHWDRGRMRVTWGTTERWSKTKMGTESRMKMEQYIIGTWKRTEQ